jgi:mRNA-degrading endonuclease HigB of HigAB toxin-antitoxin module
MKVIGKDKLDAFGKGDIAARKDLAAWLKIVQEADWRHFIDVRKTIPKASGAARGNATVFDICHGQFRLITIIDYQIKTVLIKEFLTHKAYDRWNKG